MKAFPPPGKPMADRETKTEAELTALVLQTVRDAGFAWVEAVKLQSYPARNPNWALTQIVGEAPTPIHAFWAQHHPTVAELQERYLLKLGS
jgi:hypothetical protein